MKFKFSLIFGGILFASTMLLAMDFSDFCNLSSLKMQNYLLRTAQLGEWVQFLNLLDGETPATQAKVVMAAQNALNRMPRSQAAQRVAQLQGQVNTVTITRNSSGKYVVALVVEEASLAEGSTETPTISTSPVAN